MSPHRQVATAVGVGAVAGCLIILDGSAAAVVVLATAAIGGVLVLGPERVAIAAWAATAFIAPLSGVRMAGLALSDVFLIVAVGLTLPSFAAGYRKLPLPVSPEVFVGLAAIACGGLIGTFFAGRPEVSLAEMARFVLACAGSVAAVALWGPSRSQIRWFCSLWLGGAMLNALWAILASSPAGRRPSGLSTHPNHLGMVCMLGIGLALGLALAGRRPARQLATAALPLLVVGLVLSGSRAALLGLVVIVPVFAVLCRRVQVGVRAVFVVAVLGMGVLAGVAHVPEESGLGRLIGGRSAASSDIERVEHLSRSLDRFERHPLTGQGFESSQEAHNIYLQVAVAAGPLGVLGLALVARSVVRINKRQGWAGGAPLGGDRALLAGLIAGYVGYLVAGAFQNLLWDRYLWLYVAVTLVLGATLADEADRAHDRGPRRMVARARRG